MISELLLVIALLIWCINVMLWHYVHPLVMLEMEDKWVLFWNIFHKVMAAISIILVIISMICAKGIIAGIVLATIFIIVVYYLSK